MGRRDFSVKHKRGIGKKGRKQKLPDLDKYIKDDDDDAGEKQLSSRQKQRFKKRELKRKAEELDIPVVSAKKKKSLFDEEDDDDSALGQEMYQEFPPDEFSEVEEDEDGQIDKDERSNNESSISGDSDDDIPLIEKQSKKLEKQQKQIEADDRAEQEEAAAKLQISIPTLEEIKEEVPDMNVIHSRIKDVAFILNDFSKRREDGRKRKDYIEILKQDLLTYYSYNDFMIQKLIEFFSPVELIEFLEANEAPRPVTIRVNTLKTRRKQLAQSLINSGINVDVIPWSKVGLVVYNISGSVSLGATPEYMAGHYLLQGAASFLPVMALAPKENENILDMCAAPGGKATHIAAMMRNTGLLVSNDSNRDRCKALVGNFHRMGILNTVISCNDGRKLPKAMPNFFDRVLLDAPCTGTGVISKDERVKMGKEFKDLQRCSHLQKDLLLAAIDCTNALSKSGGYVCYATCSVMIEEDEFVIDYVLKKRDVKLMPTGLNMGKEGLTSYRGKQLHPSLSLCRRVYPHMNNMDGFFIAKLKKISNKIVVSSPKQLE